MVFRVYMSASFAGFRRLQFASMLKRIMNDSDYLLSRAFQILPPYVILWHKEHTAKSKTDTLLFSFLKNPAAYLMDTARKHPPKHS